MRMPVPVARPMQVRAGRGAALRLPIARGSLQDLQQLAAARKLLLLAAEPDESHQATHPRSNAAGAQTASSTDVAGGEAASGPAVCLVLGSEGQGLSPDVLASCTPVAIPMAGGQMESLNVGIAGGILMFVLSTGMPQLAGRLDHVLGRSTQSS